MRNVKIVLLLVLAIFASLTSGTLAVYNMNFEAAEGSVVAKEFQVNGGSVEGDNQFTYNLKIAPKETVEWKFSIQNHKNEIISEVPIDLYVAVNVTNADGKQAILPLISKVYDEDGNLIAKGSGITSLEYKDYFPLNTIKQNKTYTVKVYWPSTLSDDEYISAQHGSKVSVSLYAEQCINPDHDHIYTPIEDTQDENDDDEDDEDDNDIEFVPRTNKTVKVNSQWPKKEETNIKMYPGSIFYYETNGKLEYYVVYVEANVNGTNHPEHTSFKNNIVKINTSQDAIVISREGWKSIQNPGQYDNLISVSRFNSTYQTSLTKGDMVYYNNKYYVYLQRNGSSVGIPGESTDWILLE